VVENGVRKTYSARYYNPATGRFMSRDPLAGKTKIPATLHKYLYVGGDPVNRIDPRGEATFIDFVIQIQKPVGYTLAFSLAAGSIAYVFLELEDELHIEPYPPNPPPYNPFQPYPPGQNPPITPDPGTWPEPEPVE
jgi:RHS repeat-associated protein